MPEQIDKMSEPPVVGRWYMVRTLTYRRFYSHGPLSWPIIGPKHDDVEFFDFRHQHYHADVRFLTAKHLRQTGPHYLHPANKFASALATPCSGVGREPLPEPALTRMQCRRNWTEYPFSGSTTVAEMNGHYAGQTALLSKRGWVCPHRKVPLGNHVPDGDGIITCPLHGLRIDAVTGKCVGPLAQEAA